MCQHNLFTCDLCGKEFTTQRSVLNHKAAGHQDPIKRLVGLAIGKAYGLKEESVTDSMRESIIKLKSEKMIKPWDWENVCRLILKPSNDLYNDYKLLKKSTHHALDWYLILYGDVKGKEMHTSWVHTLKSVSPSHPEYYLMQGMSEEDSYKLSKIKHKERSQKGRRAASNKIKGSSLYTIRSTAYWVTQGLSHAEAKIKVHEIQDTRSLKSFIKRHGPTGELLYNKTIDQWRHAVKITCIERGHWVCPSKKQHGKITKEQLLTLLNSLINPTLIRLTHMEKQEVKDGNWTTDTV